MAKNKSESTLYDIAAQYIDNFQQQSSGAVFEWNDARADEFSRIPLETLIKDPYFLGMKDKVYDGVLEDLVDLWRERQRRDINLALFMEGIGSGKTVKASILLWLQWFELSMTVDPQNFFDLAPNSVIAFINMNRTERQAKKVTFTEVFNRFNTPFNKDYFPVSEKYTTEIRIPRNNTCIFPGTSSALSALGYNLYGGVIDEAAFLETSDDSSKSFDGNYDAAEDMYNAIKNRMVSRFMRKGKLPGMIAMISSPNFPDDFMHRMMDKADKLGDKSGIFYRRRPTWEAKGKKFYPEDEYFYMDTDSSEVIEDPEVNALLDCISGKNFPLKGDTELLTKLAKFYKPNTNRRI
jgi:hypothetical protein